MVGGSDPFYLKFWVNRPRWSEIANKVYILHHIVYVNSIRPSVMTIFLCIEQRDPTSLEVSLFYSALSQY